MIHSRLLSRLRRGLQRPGGRRLFLSLTALMLLVQTGLPAHEDTHPIGYPDTHCQYCVMAGHLFSVTAIAIALPTPPLRAERPLAVLIEFHVPTHPRTHFSRGPPSEISM